MNQAPDRNRLRWRCRRGLLELDLVLERFLECDYERLAPPMREAFERMLETPDQTLLDWLNERQEPNDPDLRQIVRIIVE